MEALITFIALSGLLTAATGLKDALHLALSAALPATVAAPFKQLLDDAHAVPSPSTVYRHRLTLHL
eukprot:2350366-Alexandrium_andersonii.AAC.1